MSNAYKRWIEGLRGSGVPTGFSERVMADVERRDVAAVSRFERLWQIPAVRAAVWVAGFLVLAARLVFAGSVFLFN